MTDPVRRSEDPLVDDLRALGAALPAPAPGDDLAAVVMARVAEEPVPRPTVLRRCAGWLRARWRALLAALTGVVLVAALTPPVRAAVVRWLGIGAVEVRTSSGAAPSVAPPPPAAGGAVTLEQARALVAFDVMVPAELGPPSGLEVSDDRMVVSMSWSDGPHGTVRLDQIGARLAPYFVKTVYDEIEFTRVAGADAFWLAGPHEVVVERPGGTRRREPARLAGRTLIWQSGDVTLRLEGELERARAVQIAESAR